MVAPPMLLLLWPLLALLRVRFLDAEPVSGLRSVVVAGDDVVVEIEA